MQTIYRHYGIIKFKQNTFFKHPIPTHINISTLTRADLVKSSNPYIHVQSFINHK